MKPYLIGMFLGIMVMGGIWYYAARNKEPEHDFEAENIILRKQIGETEEKYFVQMDSLNLVRKADHDKDSLYQLSRINNKKSYDKKIISIDRISIDSAMQLRAELRGQFRRSH